MGVQLMLGSIVLIYVETLHLPGIPIQAQVVVSVNANKCVRGILNDVFLLDANEGVLGSTKLRITTEVALNTRLETLEFLDL